MLLGLLLLVLGLGRENVAVKFLFTVAGTMIAGSGLYRLWMAKASYGVTVASSGGEIRALTSADKDYISKIVASINEAIVRCR
jgi:hypothetical protein